MRSLLIFCSLLSVVHSWGILGLNRNYWKRCGKDLSRCSPNNNPCCAGYTCLRYGTSGVCIHNKDEKRCGFGGDADSAGLIDKGEIQEPVVYGVPTMDYILPEQTPDHEDKAETKEYLDEIAEWQDYLLANTGELCKTGTDCLAGLCCVTYNTWSELGFCDACT